FPTRRSSDLETLLAGLDAWPAYYAHMGPANSAGPTAPDLSEPRRAEAAELRRRIEAGEWVVDLRTRTAFAAGHMAGTLNFGLDGQMSTYLGWLIPWGTPVTLLGETPEDVAEAQRELVRIGIDRPAAAATGGPERWAGGEPLASVHRASFDELVAVRHHRPVVVLDVRRALEWKRSHIDGAWPRSPTARCGCTARAATAPPSPPRCWPPPGGASSPSTTSTAPARACRSSRPPPDPRPPLTCSRTRPAPCPGPLPTEGNE